MVRVPFAKAHVTMTEGRGGGKVVLRRSGYGVMGGRCGRDGVLGQGCGK